jgi:predicted alpha/beta superfamily hydrolase
MKTDMNHKMFKRALNLIKREKLAILFMLDGQECIIGNFNFVKELMNEEIACEKNKELNTVNSH